MGFDGTKEIQNWEGAVLGCLNSQPTATRLRPRMAKPVVATDASSSRFFPMIGPTHNPAEHGSNIPDARRFAQKAVHMHGPVVVLLHERAPAGEHDDGHAR
jgi:hypothetical protein